jgi:Domain of unknown function (DUF1918)
MRSSRTELKASPGDRLVVHGHRQGEPERDGEIVEVIGAHGTPPYVVRWEDGRVSTLYPSSDVFVQHFEHPKSRSARKAHRAIRG